MGGATEPNSATVIAENEVGAGGVMSGASMQSRSSPIDSTAISRWLQPKNRTFENIRKDTIAYLEQSEVKQWLEQCPKILVESRRNQAKSNLERWKRTCFSIRYECTVNGGPQAD